jgi:hypothetical protein
LTVTFDKTLDASAIDNAPILAYLCILTNRVILAHIGSHHDRCALLR